MIFRQQILSQFTEISVIGNFWSFQELFCVWQRLHLDVLSNIPGKPKNKK